MQYMASARAPLAHRAGTSKRAGAGDIEQRSGFEVSKEVNKVHARAYACRPVRYLAAQVGSSGNRI